MSDEEQADRLPALYAELNRLAEEARKVTESPSTELVHVGSADPEVLREQMIATRREAAEQARALRKAADKTREEIRREVDRQRSAMEAQMAAALAELAPLQEKVEQMEEGIWTVNLYLGTSEEVVRLAKGKPASIDTPITLRTSVLAMDEEVASFPVEDGKTDWQGMDFRDLGIFDEWLMEDPEHLAQVLPEPKGIVVLTPRRTTKEYSDDPLMNAAMNEENFKSYWLIRNGENVYRLRTNFTVGKTLMPVTSEFTALFQTTRHNWETGESEVVEVKPGTREWEQAEKAQDKRRRHYMRTALIIQGLIDRTEMFHPLHAAVNVMQQATYDDGLVVVVNDTDNILMSTREPYRDWIRRLNRELRPGMRIIGHFRHSDFHEAPYDWRTDRRNPYKNERVHPQGASSPESNVIHLIEDRRKDGALVIRYKRTDKVYGRGYWDDFQRESKVRASARIYPGDAFIIPFDLVTEAEMLDYLGARSERHAYAEMFPLLQAAVAAKAEERAAEAPFRDLLIRVLADDNDQQAEEVEPHIDGLVHRFKVGNKWHRPLVSLSSEEEAKAIRLIRAEYKRIVDSGATAERDAAAVAALRKHDDSIMFVGRLSSGKYVAFAPMPRAYPEKVVSHRLWVREHTTGKTARSIKTREWIAPGVRGSKMTTLFETEQWTDWDVVGDARSDLTDDEFEAMLAEVRERAADELSPAKVLAVLHEREERRWTVYGARVGHADTGYYREPTALYEEVTFSWERQDGTPVLSKPRGTGGGRDFELSYAGNHHIDGGTPAREREVYLPWWYAVSRTGRMREKQTRAPKETLVWEVDKATRDAVIEWVYQREEAADEARYRDGLVDKALRWIEEQQVDALVAAIKAKFLAEYPDEEMWNEKRRELTKNVRRQIAVEVTDNGTFGHFARTEPTEQKGVRSVHKRDDHHKRLDHSLNRLIKQGNHDWAGLTVGDVYRLLGETIPDVYEPIAGLLLADPEAEPDDDE